MKRLDKFARLMFEDLVTNVREAGYNASVLKSGGDIGEAYSRAMCLYESAVRMLRFYGREHGQADEVERFLVSTYDPRTVPVGDPPKGMDTRQSSSILRGGYATEASASGTGYKILDVRCWRDSLTVTYELVPVDGEDRGNQSLLLDWTDEYATPVVTHVTNNNASRVNVPVPEVRA